MVGGHDTTALTVSRALYDLAAHPEEQEAVRAELRAASDKSKPGPRLSAALKESMRLGPVAGGGSIRQTSKDYALPDGTVIPAGSVVQIPFHGMFRHEQTFEDPDEFRTERWLESLDSKGSDQGREQLATAYMPFSLGRRNCVGQALAQSQLNTVLPMLFADYHWEVVQAPISETFLTTKPAGLLLRAHRVP